MQNKLHAKLIRNTKGGFPDPVIVDSSSHQGWLSPISACAYHLLTRLALSQSRGIDSRKLTSTEWRAIHDEIEDRLGIVTKQAGGRIAALKHIEIRDLRKASAAVSEAA